MGAVVDVAPAESFLRIASMAIGGYDYLLTLPAEFRFYKAQRESGRLNISCALFIVIRYFSIVLVVTGNLAWFATFSQEYCNRFSLLPGIFRVVQSMVAQIILGLRAYNLSKRSPVIGWSLLGLYGAVSILEWIANVYSRITVLGPSGNCHSYPTGPHQFPGWIHYMAVMVFDFFSALVSFVYLLKYRTQNTTSIISKTIKIMLHDGLVYFVLLTAINLVNVLIYPASTSTRSAGVSIGYVVTWIMSQRLLIHINDAAIARRHANAVITITNTPDSSPQANRQPFGTQYAATKNTEWTIPNLDLASTIERGEEVDVHVRLESRVRSSQLDEVDLSRVRGPDSSSIWIAPDASTRGTCDSQLRPRMPDPRPPKDPLMQTRYV